MGIRTAIVTGGASGIGRNLVALLAARGYLVALVDINRASAEAEAAKLNEEHPGTVEAHQLDTTDKEGTRAFLASFVIKHGRIDLFFPNAGVAEHPLYPRLEHATEEIQEPDMRTLDVDLFSPIYSTALVLQYMQRQEPDGEGIRGKVILTSSIFGLWPSPYLPMYQAAKHAIVGYVRSWGQVTPSYGITVNCVCPSITPSGLGPPEAFAAAEEGKFLTPMKTVIDAFARFIDDASLSGRASAVSMDDIVDMAPPPVINPQVRSACDFLNKAHSVVPYSPR